MDVRGRVAAILTEAERKVGDLVADAARERDYEAVRWLSEVAQRVAAAAGPGDPAAASVEDGDGQIAGSAAPPPMPEVEAPAPEIIRSPAGAVRAVAASHGAATAEAGRFPRFHREGDHLVKVGYSKSDRRTYEHRCPRDTLGRVAAVVGDLGRGGRRFTTEQMFPSDAASDPAPLAGVPSYQVYLCLAFLIRRGLVRRHGRAGYTVEGGGAADLRAGVEAAWASLPVR